MKNVLFSLIFLLSCHIGYAQQILISSMEEISSDSIQFQVNNNGETCALIILEFEAENIIIEGNVINTSPKQNGTLYIWLDPDTKMMRVKALGKYPLLIRFSEHGITKVVSGKAYKLSLCSKDGIIQKESASMPEFDDPITVPNVIFDGDTRNNIQISSSEESVYRDRMSEIANLKGKRYIEALEKLHNKGYWKATLRLAECKLKGYDCKKNIEESKKLSEHLVETISFKDCEEVGDKLLEFGFYDLAMKSYSKDASHNLNSDCFIKIGDLYENGLGVNHNKEKAVEYYKYASRKSKQYKNAFFRLISMGEFVCSKQALETQHFDVFGKTKSDLDHELQTELNSYNKPEGIDYPKIFLINKALADLFNDKSALADMARIYDGKGGYPLYDQQTAEMYSERIREIKIKEALDNFQQYFSNYKTKIESDTITFTDYSMVKIGDILYSDGTFSHEINTRKEPSGVVFSLKTSSSEEEAGYNHGYVISFFDTIDRYGNDRFFWSETDSTSLNQFSNSINNAKSDVLGWEKNLRMGGNDFWANYTTINHYATLPKGKTSGWYLPSVGQMILLIENLTKVKMGKKGYFDNSHLKSKYPLLYIQSDLSSLFTSSEFDQNRIWVLNEFSGSHYISYHNVKNIIEFDVFGSSSWNVFINTGHVRPIASF